MDARDLRTTIDELLGPGLARLRGAALGLMLLGALLAAVTAATALPRFWESYLFAYLFWFGVTAGCTGLLFLHNAVGGGWGYVIRRFLEAGSRLWWLAALGFLPLVAPLLGAGVPALWSSPQGVGHVVGWASAAAAHDHVIREKIGYLNIPFFLIRAALYFLLLGLGAWAVNRWSRILDERRDPAVFEKANVWSGFGILAYVIVMSFVSVDWVMSLEPTWFSSIFGLLTVASQALSTIALMLVLVWWVAAEQPLLARVPSGYFRDLGNLMLALVMLWAYLSFGQYLIIFSGNLTEEVPWYIHRNQNGWWVFAAALMALHFALPFGVLLVGSDVKRHPNRLGKVALFLVFIRHVDLFWQVAPTFRADPLPGLHTLADFGVPLFMAGAWLTVWTTGLRGRTLVPLHDPRVEEVLAEQAHGHAHGAATHHG